VRHFEHARLRELRLASLRSDPDAFGSTYARAAGQSPDWWIQWAQRSETGATQRTFVLVSDRERWLGLALVRLDDDNPGSALLNAIWVAPEARGQHGAIQLCDARATWAAQHGCAEITLTVVVDNHSARRAYEAGGFAICGQTTWSRDGRILDEFVMSRPLGSAAD
jgi:RimJ/RimL family protein N-acetyltransferase